MDQDIIRKLRPELFSENKFYVDECLNNHGALTGLQLAINREDWLDTNYAIEKCDAVCRVIQGARHNLEIVERYQERDPTPEELAWLKKKFPNETFISPVEDDDHE